MHFPYPVDLKDNIEREEVGPMAQRYNFTVGVEEKNLVPFLAFLTSQDAMIREVMELSDHIEVRGHFGTSENALALRNAVMDSENIVEPEFPTASGSQVLNT